VRLRRRVLQRFSATSNSVRINLGGSALIPSHGLPAKEEITSFQNRLHSYRLLNHDQVAAANFRVSGFRPEISIVADVLAAATWVFIAGGSAIPAADLYLTKLLSLMPIR